MNTENPILSGGLRPRALLTFHTVTRALLPDAPRALDTPPHRDTNDAWGSRAPSPETVFQRRMPPPRPHRILVADDDAIVRGSLGAVLELEGFQVDEACTGSEAVRAAITSSPDLILLDLNMPDWDGWTAFGHLDRVRPFVPVIVITARPNQFPTAATLGVDAFMEKPLNFTVLLRAIRQLLGEEISRHERRATERDFITRYLDGSHEG